MRTWKRFAIGVIAVSAFAVPGAATADHGCNGEISELPGPGFGGPLYLDDRGGAENSWVYLESNKTEGLQTGGAHPVLGYEDPCAHENPDTLLY